MEKDKSMTNHEDDKASQIEIKEGYQPKDELDTSLPPNNQQESTAEEQRNG